MTKIILNEGICNYIESLQYDLEARKTIIAFMLQNDFNVNSKSFKAYQEGFRQALIKYDVAKNELQKRYGIKGKWTLNFAERELSYDAV